MDVQACNYNLNANIDSLCIYSIDLDECASCSGEQDGSGTIVDNDDDDDDTVCNNDEIDGCTDSTMYNYNNLATDDDGTLSYN